MPFEKQETTEQPGKIVLNAYLKGRPDDLLAELENIPDEQLPSFVEKDLVRVLNEDVSLSTLRESIRKERQLRESK